jgi:hypothetical protein
LQQINVPIDEASAESHREGRSQDNEQFLKHLFDPFAENLMAKMQDVEIGEVHHQAIDSRYHLAKC